MSDIKVFIVDDHPIVRRGLTHFINSKKGFAVCGEAEDANSAIARINLCDPDIVIVDIGLRDISGIDLIKSIHSRYKRIRILVLTMHNEIEYVERAIHAGASGYVLKSEREEQIIEAFSAILSQKRYISDSLKELLVEKMLWESGDKGNPETVSLTERERDILAFYGKGLNTRQISERLSLTVSTISTYRDRIKRKLHINSNSEMIRYAIKNDITGE